MPDAAPDPQAEALAEAVRLEFATDQAIEACGGDLRATVRALIVANEFLETQVSKEYTRGFRAGFDEGRWKAYSG